MTSKDVKNLIKNELLSQTDLTNVYGINLNDCLIEPLKENYKSSVDEGISLLLWTVLEETKDQLKTESPSVVKDDPRGFEYGGKFHEFKSAYGGRENWGYSFSAN